MNYEFTHSRFFDIGARQLFTFWIRPELLEQWCAPHGMELEVPVFEARPNGRYQFIHRHGNETYDCTGYLKEYEPNQKLVMVDSVMNDKGELLHDKLEATVEFREHDGVTQVILTQTNFSDQSAADDCKQGWLDCFNQLEELIEGKVFDRPSKISSNSSLKDLEY